MEGVRRRKLPSWGLALAAAAVMLLLSQPAVTDSSAGLPERLPSARSGAAATAQDGLVYILGGQVSGGVLGEVLIHDLAAGTVAPAPWTLPYGLARAGHADAHGHAYLFGGYTGPGPTGAVTFSDAILRVEPTAGRVTPMAARLPVPQEGTAVTWTGSTFLGFGGWDGTRALSTIWSYDPATDTLTVKGERLPSARSLAVAGWDPVARPWRGCPAGCAYVFAGSDAGNGATVGAFWLRTVERYDPAGDRIEDSVDWWSDTRSASSIFRAGRDLYVLGGGSGTVGASVWRFNTSREELEPMPSALTEPRRLAALAFTGGAAFLYGGNPGGDRIERYGLEPGPIRDTWGLHPEGGGTQLDWTLPDPMTTEGTYTAWRIHRGTERGAESLLAEVTDAEVRPDPYAYWRRFLDTTLPVQDAVYHYRLEGTTPYGPVPPAVTARGPVPGLCARPEEVARHSTCFVTLAAGQSLDVRGWTVWRGWDLTVNATLHNAASVRVERLHEGKPLESAKVSGPGRGILGKDLVGHLDKFEDGVPEVVRLTNLGAEPADVSLRLHQTVNDYGDCGAADASVAAPLRIAPGARFACHGALADGFRMANKQEGIPEDAAGDSADAFVIAVTDGDLLNATLTGEGRSYHLGLYSAVGGLRDRLGTTLRPPPLGTGSLTRTHEAVSDGDRTVLVEAHQPDVEMVGTHVLWRYDLASVAPFHYNLSVEHTRNARPTLLFQPPAVLHDGDVPVATLTVWDADGDVVRPYLEAWDVGGPDGRRALAVTFDAAQGPSGTTFTATVPGDIVGYQIQFVVDAYDARGVRALPHVRQTVNVPVRPADCGPNRGDAPPEGRIFVGTCAASVGRLDPEDRFLLDVPAGSRLHLAASAYVAVTVEAPDGVVRTLPGGTALVDYAAGGGRYALTVRDTVQPPIYVAYTLTASLEPVSPPPTDALGAERWTLLRVEDAAAVFSGSVPLHGVQPVLERRMATPQEYALAPVRVEAYGLAGVCGAQMRAVVDGVAGPAFDPCQVWPRTAFAWGDVPVGRLALTAGDHTLRLEQVGGSASMSVGLDTADSRGRSRGNAPLAGELMLRLRVGGADPAAIGGDVLLILRDDDGRTLDRTGVVDWGDGSSTQRLLPWRVEVESRHAYAQPGIHALSATATRTGAPPHGPWETSLLVHPDDCGSGVDAGPSVIHVRGSCSGHVGASDPADPLHVRIPAGHHATLTLDGADGVLVAPDGSARSFVDGLLHAYAASEGVWRVEVTRPAPGPYAFTFQSVPAAAPTGRVDAAARSLVAAASPWTVTATLLDAHYEPVAVTVDWGDGTVERWPATGWWPSEAIPRTVSHSYANEGAYAVTLTAVARDGRALPATAGLLAQVVRPDDCGTPDGDAANQPWMVLDGPATPLAPGSCRGSVSATDVADHYRFDAGVHPFSFTVTSGNGVTVSATLYWSAADVSGGVRHGWLARSSGPDAEGRTTGDSGSLGLGAGWYVLEIRRVAGAGVYEVRIDR